MYEVAFSKEARQGYLLLAKKAPNAIKKLSALIDELKLHPRTGTGKVEVLKHQQGREIFSRRITQEHRLVYTIEENIVRVQIISVFGHYDN